MARQHGNRRRGAGFCQCIQIIAIILRDSAVPAKCVCHEGENGPVRGHAHPTFAKLWSTVRDQWRDICPLDSTVRPLSPKTVSVAVEFIHAPTGTLKPVFPRATISAGNETLGAFASAFLPVRGARLGIAGARVL